MKANCVGRLIEYVADTILTYGLDGAFDPTEKEVALSQFNGTGIYDSSAAIELMTDLFPDLSSKTVSEEPSGDSGYGRLGRVMTHANHSITGMHVSMRNGLLERMFGHLEQMIKGEDGDRIRARCRFFNLALDIYSKAATASGDTDALERFGVLQSRIENEGFLSETINVVGHTKETQDTLSQIRLATSGKWKHLPLSDSPRLRALNVSNQMFLDGDSGRQEYQDTAVFCATEILAKYKVLIGDKSKDLGVMIKNQQEMAEGKETKGCFIAALGDGSRQVGFAETLGGWIIFPVDDKPFSVEVLS